ncbi:unnamed protein product [Chondrus crispus]|uniref:Cytochrome b5 heme-binding domain-containing protein n=1 Tax=Chondrus crispus TaxID=2769 RepID=R7QKJ9_CHOCR|nr:unnamed protein product [Chondrus crispus]CDF37981.1 unnamed protein product [Chondrus crispus]|eukprot:XP_005717850.1 unnamed protein product [Chondrus crispus]
MYGGAWFEYTQQDHDYETLHTRSQPPCHKYRRLFFPSAALNSSSRLVSVLQVLCLRDTLTMSEEAKNSVPEITVGTGGFIVAAATVGILIAFVLRAILKSVTKPAAGSGSESEMQSSAATQSGVVTESQLKDATGEDDKPLYIAVKDPFGSSVTVFDVSGGSDFYGPGGPYHVFAGKNATHGLAKSSTDAAKVYGDLDKLTESEKDTHMQWYQKYESKYPNRFSLETTLSVLYAR